MQEAFPILFEYKPIGNIADCLVQGQFEDSKRMRLFKAIPSLQA